MARIKWDKEWIIQNFDLCGSLKELNDKYNDEHGTDIGYRTFKGVCQRNGLYKCNLTKEEDAFLRQVYPKCGVKETARLFNEKFGKNKTESQIRHLVQNRGLRITDDALYRQLRVRKFCKMQVGETSKGWKVPYVKVANGRFVIESRYNYERYYGEIPKGYHVINLDGDKTNNQPDNLMAIPKAYHAKLARNGLFSSNAEITKGAIMCFVLQDKINDLAKMKGGDTE